MRRSYPIAFIAALATSPLTAAADVSAVLRACDDIAALLAPTPQAHLTRRDGRFINPRFAGREHDGCRVELRGTRRMDRLNINLQSPFEARGWIQHPEYAADGHDGSAYAYFHRPDLTLCLVSESWHGDANDDPSYKPPEDYRIEVACTHDSTLASYVTPLEEMERQPRVIHRAPLPSGPPIRLPDGRILVPAGSMPSPDKR